MNEQQRSPGEEESAEFPRAVPYKETPEYHRMKMRQYWEENRGKESSYISEGWNEWLTEQQKKLSSKAYFRQEMQRVADADNNFSHIHLNLPLESGYSCRVVVGVDSVSIKFYFPRHMVKENSQLVVSFNNREVTFGIDFKEGSRYSTAEHVIPKTLFDDKNTALPSDLTDMQLEVIKKYAIE